MAGNFTETAQWTANVPKISTGETITETLLNQAPQVLADRLQYLKIHRHDGSKTPIDYAVDTGASNAYAIALTPALTANVTGMPIRFKAANANTGASTLNINSLGAATIKKNATTDLAANDIKAGQLVTVIYDGTYFQLVNNGQAIDRSMYTNSMATNGWRKGPDGIIEQWGFATTSSGGLVSVTFPITFPNTAFSPILGLNSGLPVTGLLGWSNLTTSGMTLNVSNTSGAGITAVIAWKVVGY